MLKYQFLPSLLLDEYEALRESIREKGVIEPVVTDEDGNVIDGHHRVKVCKELGIEYPTRVVEGISEEQKQDLSVELNMRRRHLTKEQKKELAVNLREQGWTQERIGKALGVERSTVSKWFVNFHIPDQPSPKQPDPEVERLKKELVARDDFERRQAKEAEELRRELEAAKNTPVIEKPVESPELLKRLKRLEEELEDAKQIDQKTIDEMVAAKTAAKLAEIEEQKQALDRKFEEASKRYTAISDDLHKRRQALEEQMAEKIREIERAAKLDKDAGEMERERDRLAGELDLLKSALESEQESAKIRERVRTLEKTAAQIPTLVFLLKEKIEQSPNACGLTIDDLKFLRSELVTIEMSATDAVNILEGKIETMQKKGGVLKFAK